MDRQEIDKSYVQNLILGAAPERKDDVRAFWDQYNPKVFLAPDHHRILVQARSTCIEFSSRAMELMWLLGFAAWRAFVSYCPSFVLSSAGKARVAELIGEDRGFGDAEAAMESLLLASRALVGIAAQEEFGWPDDVPRPHNNRDVLDDTQKSIFDLTCIATAYVFLHEIRHVQFAQGSDRPPPAEEELLCDVFARDFLMGKLSTFSSRTPWEHDMLVMKRGMGLTLGAFALYELTDRSQHVGSEDYPPIGDRLAALIGNMPVADHDHPFWIFAATLIAAVARRRSRAVTLEGSSARAICERLIDQIREQS